MITDFASVGMPLVKTVTSAGPDGKAVIGLDVKRLSDQRRKGSDWRKTTSLLSMLRNCTFVSFLAEEGWVPR